jgi:hypothetical protein
VGWQQMEMPVPMPPIPPTPAGAAEQTIVAVYSYKWTDGREAFHVVRFEPKNFRQRHRGRHGKWIWNLDGCEPVLYRLTDVLHWFKTTNCLFVCEGEKDVDALWAIGIPATCGRGGSGGASLWRQGAYSRWLADVDLAILWDNDLAGHNLALAIAEAGVGLCATVLWSTSSQLGQATPISRKLPTYQTGSPPGAHATSCSSLQITLLFSSKAISKTA